MHSRFRCLLIEFTMKHSSQIINRGYTLVELMVAISILALLFVAGVTSYSKATQRSRDAKRKSDIEQLRSALEMYRADNGTYPSTQGEVPIFPAPWKDIADAEYALLKDALVPNYIPELPTDSQSGFSYWYQSPITVDTKTYCFTAFMEVTNDTGNCTGYVPVPLPDGAAYSYGAKNP